MSTMAVISMYVDARHRGVSKGVIDFSAFTYYHRQNAENDRALPDEGLKDADDSSPVSGDPCDMDKTHNTARPP